MKWIVPGRCTIHFSFISAYRDWRCCSHWGDTGAAWQDNMIKARIRPYFAPLGLQLREVTPQHIENFYQSILADDCTTNTVIHYHAIIRKALQTAVKKDILLKNPADKVDRPKKNVFHGSFYSEEEMLRYTNTGTAQTVTIQTDGGNLTVDAPNDTVYHYGTAGLIDIIDVASNSYHEFGDVGVLSITDGRAVIEKGDGVKTTQVKGENAVIAVPQNVVLKTELQKAESVPKVTLNVINNAGTVIDEKTITTADGTTTATVPAELKEVLNVVGKTIGTAKNYVAINGETYYDSLQEAVNAGGTVKLVNHVSLTSTLEVSKIVTINMNGYNITGNGVRAIQVKQGTLTLDGTGTVSSTVANVGSSVIRVGDNAATSSAKLYVQKGVTVSTETAYGITAFGNKYEYVYVYGTVTSAAPENADYDGCAISTLGTDKNSYIYIYDGATVSAANTNAIYMPSGTLYVYDGATVTGRTGIYVKSGTTSISGGTITGNGSAVAYNYYGNGGISTGDALVVDSCGYPSGKPSVTVSGGTFTSANAKAVASYNTEGNALVTGFVKGGTFSSDPSDYVTFGYKAANAGNTWSVSKSNSTAEEPMHITSKADWLALAAQASSSSATAGQY